MGLPCIEQLDETSRHQKRYAPVVFPDRTRVPISLRKSLADRCQTCLAPGRFVALGLVGRNPVRHEPCSLAQPVDPLLFLMFGGFFAGKALVAKLVAIGSVQ